MNFQLPEIDGLQATQKIRALQGNKTPIRIIALTANATQANEEVCYRAGMKISS